MHSFYDLDPVYQALVATTGTWLLTALGATLVLFTARVSQAYLDASLGVAAGVMIAASFWSLLNPSIAMAVVAGYGAYQWVPAAVGFVSGAIFLRVIDRLLPHLHPDLQESEGPKTSWRRSTLLVLAITLHHIPEGLAVGVAFGAAAAAHTSAEHLGQVGSAVALAVGIALQNFPEGTAVALPLRREGLSRGNALWWAQLSGLVDPLAGVAGAALVVLVRPILPYALAFAAGAMMFVVAEQLIPESQRHGHVDLATMGVIVGFALMMMLDVGLA
jgi:ZIP family zinc transporter